MKISLSIALAVLGLIIMCASARAQFEQNHHYVGATVGLSNVGSDVSFGADYEQCVTGKVGPGRFGVGASVRYWSFDDWYYGWAHAYSLNYFAINGTGSYHFAPSDTRWDPFIGLSLGYYVVDADGPWDEYGYGRSHGGSRLYLGLHAGARYFVTPSLALQARIGFDADVLSVGATWKF